jgi:hypothetical protein
MPAIRLNLDRQDVCGREQNKDPLAPKPLAKIACCSCPLSTVAELTIAGLDALRVPTRPDHGAKLCQPVLTCPRSREVSGDAISCLT